MDKDEPRLRAALEMMQRNGLYAAQSEEQMHQLLLEFSQWVGESGGEEWDEFEDED